MKEDPTLISCRPTLSILSYCDLSQFPRYFPISPAGLPRGKDYNCKTWQNPQMNQTESVNND